MPPSGRNKAEVQTDTTTGQTFHWLRTPIVTQPHTPSIISTPFSDHMSPSSDTPQRYSGSSDENDTRRISQKCTTWPS
ncbi:hypothetical protein V1264_019081 [Littorina saxatilis]|uniref:Uncharacterized protein n=1 Tax=Littorina saxatilis TaxID=31220 RepID=A0AAN9BF43_9CAEN